MAELVGLDYNSRAAGLAVTDLFAALGACCGLDDRNKKSVLSVVSVSVNRDSLCVCVFLTVNGVDTCVFDRAFSLAGGGLDDLADCAVCVSVAESRYLNDVCLVAACALEGLRTCRLAGGSYIFFCQLNRVFVLACGGDGVLLEVVAA